MNIFYLDRDPVIAAQMMCDKHCIKMILESAQMLSTTHRVLDGEEYANKMGLYKLAHKNHPSTIWVRTSEDNYDWLWQHMCALMKEYTHRYGKRHATERLTDPLCNAPDQIGNGEFTDPPQCMPDYCKGEDTVMAYQTYYILKKSGFARWTKRQTPEWFNGQRTVLGLHGKKTERGTANV